MSDRERLPSRRVSELVDFEHGGRKWTLTVGRFADGRVGEVPPPSERSRPMPQSLPRWLSNTAPRWKRCAMRLQTAVRAPGCGAGVDRRLSGPT
jgi:hypothetical protein